MQSVSSLVIVPKDQIIEQVDFNERNAIIEVNSKSNSIIKIAKVSVLGNSE